MRLELLVGVLVGVWGVACAEPFVTAESIVRDGRTPCSDAVQALIDAHPNREIVFPDGVYLLDKPILTPADPKRSVCLRLSAYATFRAAPGWTNREAMVRLGASHPANDICTNGSDYWFKGGIVDGSGVADGLSIDGGRETLVSDVSIKHTRIGLRIKKGANSGSADADIRNVNIVGNGAADSVGVLVEASDNTLSHMRIARVVTGVRIDKCGGNICRDLHPLYTCRNDLYAKSVGFDIRTGDNWFDVCYSDQFRTGFRLGDGNRSIFDKCNTYWYLTKTEMDHIAVDSLGTFNARFRDLKVGVKRGKLLGRMTVLKTAREGGRGFLQDLQLNYSEPNEPQSVHEKYLLTSSPTLRGK